MKGMLLLSALLLAPQSSPAMLWPATATPAVIDSTDTGSVELGVRFRSDVNGTVTGIRFYKAAANTGSHVGNLWTTTGANLAHATFSGESASGWQQVTFATPVTITANTVYVASVFCPAGHYSVDQHYFATARDNAPLHAPADGAQGANGVFAYGAASAFPTDTYLSSNYWVDVVFVAAATTPPPTTPPPSTTPPTPRSSTGSGSSADKPCGCGTATTFPGTWFWLGASMVLLLGLRKPS